MYCSIIIKTKKLLKEVKHEKLICAFINQHFQTPYLKKTNSDVCLAEKLHFPAGRSHKRYSIQSLVAVIWLIGISVNRCSIVPSQHLLEATEQNYENISQDIRFQIFVAMGVQTVVFWVVTWVYYCQWIPTF
jgi:hypothetical protein